MPDYGVDLSLRNIEQRGTRYLDSRLQLDLQLRSTTRAVVTDTEIRFDLDVETYDFLRELSTIRCILVVLVLPEDEASWLSQTVEELVLRRCGYWYSLRGEAPTAATSSVRVTIPRTQILTPETLRGLFDRLNQGGEP